MTSLENSNDKPKFTDLIVLYSKEYYTIDMVIESLDGLLNTNIIGKRDWKAILKQVIINKNNKLGL